MADVSTVGDSGVIQLIEAVVGPGKGGIEVIALGDDGQHPAPCGEQFAGAVAAGAGMKQLMDKCRSRQSGELPSDPEEDKSCIQLHDVLMSVLEDRKN